MIGQRILLGVALAGWISALSGDGWKILLTQGAAPAPSQVVDRLAPISEAVSLDEVSVDGIRLGDDEVQVRRLWGEPLQVETDLAHDFGERAQDGYRYLRYSGTRMVVLHNDRVVVVDGDSVGTNGRELARVGDTREEIDSLSYHVGQGACLQLAWEMEQIAFCSLSESARR